MLQTCLGGTMSDGTALLQHLEDLQRHSNEEVLTAADIRTGGKHHRHVRLVLILECVHIPTHSPRTPAPPYSLIECKAKYESLDT